MFIKSVSLLCIYACTMTLFMYFCVFFFNSSINLLNNYKYLKTNIIVFHTLKSCIQTVVCILLPNIYKIQSCYKMCWSIPVCCYIILHCVPILAHIHQLIVASLIYFRYFDEDTLYFPTFTQTSLYHFFFISTDIIFAESLKEETFQFF